MRIASASVASAAVAFGCFLATAYVLAVESEETKGLAAASNHSRYDNDHDGLTDLQEEILGTLPFRADSDADGYTDLEECARGSNPMDATSMPDPVEFSIGSCASQENGFVSVVSAVYLDNSTPTDQVNLEIGVVYRGVAYPLYSFEHTYSRAFLYRGHDSQDTLAVIEIGVPEGLVQRIGCLSMYSVIRPLGATTTADPVVTTVTLKDVNGVITSVEPRIARATNNSGGSTGIAYRPLAADDQIPSSWQGGLMCFQSTSVLGVTGVSIRHEIDEALCLPMDTYCNPVECEGSAGTSIQIPDPAALIGG